MTVNERETRGGGGLRLASEDLSMRKKNALVPEKHRLDPETIQRPLARPPPPPLSLSGTRRFVGCGILTHKAVWQRLEQQESTVASLCVCASLALFQAFAPQRGLEEPPRRRFATSSRLLHQTLRQMVTDFRK